MRPAEAGPPLTTARGGVDWSALSPADLEMALERRSFAYFVRQYWPAIEARPLVDGPHIEAMCAHLEAVTRGEIARLVIAVPPRMGKSLLVSVLWPVWTWLSEPTARFLCASYGERLALHHSVLCRSLVRHPAFSGRWSGRVRTRPDQDEKARFDLLGGGYRIATSVGGAVTGVGGTHLVLDDPLNVGDAGSLASRQTVREWYLRAFSTRTDDPATARWVQVCQRTHADDLADLWLRGGAEALVLPMEADPARSRVAAAAQWTDTREPGALLCPARYPADVLRQLRRDLGREYETQYQQDPAPEMGGLFERADFRRLGARPADLDRVVRAWDLAASAGRGDYTAGVLMGHRRSGGFVVLDVRRGRWRPGDVERQMLAAAHEDGPAVSIFVEQEMGSAGKMAVAHMQRLFAGFDVRPASVRGGKEARARPFAAQVQAGNVAVLDAPWTAAFLDELCGFPGLPHDDQVDAAAHAFSGVAPYGAVRQFLPSLG